MTENVVSPGLINTTSTTICFGEEPSSIINVVSATVSGVIEYEWEASIDNGSTFTSITHRLLTHILFLIQEIYFKLHYLEEKQQAHYLSSLTTCFEYSNTITITVLPQVVGGTITPTALTICSGEVPPQLKVVRRYNWTRSIL